MWMQDDGALVFRGDGLQGGEVERWRVLGVEGLADRPFQARDPWQVGQ